MSNRTLLILIIVIGILSGMLLLKTVADNQTPEAAPAVLPSNPPVPAPDPPSGPAAAAAAAAAERLKAELVMIRNIFAEFDQKFFFPRASQFDLVMERINLNRTMTGEAHARLIALHVRLKETEAVRVSRILAEACLEYSNCCDQLTQTISDFRGKLSTSTSWRGKRVQISREGEPSPEFFEDLKREYASETFQLETLFLRLQKDHQRIDERHELLKAAD